MHEYLVLHPSIVHPIIRGEHVPDTRMHSRKEIHYFDYDPWYYQGIQNYETTMSPQEESPRFHVCLLFINAPFHLFKVMDSTPLYLPYPTVLTRIKLAYGESPMKFIVLLRNPVDRLE